VLRGIPQDELDRMAVQAKKFGDAELSRAADVANAALTEMTGATSPRLHLELMIARILVPERDETDRGALARVERLERRIGLDGVPSEAATAAAVPAAPGPPAAAPTVAIAVSTPRVEPVEVAPPIVPVIVETAPTIIPAGAEVVAEVVAEAKTVTFQQMRDSWPEILEVVQKAKRQAWMVVYTSQARALDGDILTVTFPNETDVASFKLPQGAGEGVSEYLRKAILEVLGLRVKFIAKVEPTLAALADDDVPEPTEPDTEPAVDAAGWAVAEIPGAADERSAAVASSHAGAAKGSAAEGTSSATARSAPSRPSLAQSAPARTPPAAAKDASNPSASEPQRYGESVVREMLGASFIEEQTVAPRVTPRDN
jgi:DNA polymerase-3 subunit gamma/tau